jgi:multidrug efflux system membrane fusion protein
LGPGDATNIAVTAGLKPGDTVVVDGADKLKDGAKVLLRQRGAGSATPAATPGAAPGQSGGHRAKPSSTGS